MDSGTMGVALKRFQGILPSGSGFRNAPRNPKLFLAIWGFPKNGPYDKKYHILSSILGLSSPKP